VPGALTFGVIGFAASLIFTPMLAPAFLGFIGFSAIGPVAGKFPPKWCGMIRSAHTNKLELVGSIAAGVQAGIGNVVAGSLFAIAQSIAMGGAIPAAISAIFAAFIGIISAFISLFF
jgi:hypothetical protein